MPQIRIFLASSFELKPERDSFEKQIIRKNKTWEDRGVDLSVRLDIWEDESAQMSLTGSQSEYNKLVQDADLFALLAYTKMGKYTEEEYDVAYDQFKTTQKNPKIIVYFKNTDDAHPPADSLAQFRAKLSALGYFPPPFADANDLWNQFNIELDLFEAKFSKTQPLNEYLLKELCSAAAPYSPTIAALLAGLTGKPNWYKIADTSKDLKQALARNYAGVVGTKLSNLMAIATDDTPATQPKRYVNECIAIGRMTIQLLCFAVISDLWRKKKVPGSRLIIPDPAPLAAFFKGAELNITGYANLLGCLLAVFKENKLEFSITEITDIAGQLQPGQPIIEACSKLDKLSNLGDDERGTLKNCNTAEIQLTELLKAFSFLARYKMVSFKNVNYEEVSITPDKYLHNFALLGFGNKASKLKYVKDPVSPDSILLYKGNYMDENTSINLFPFILDYNALDILPGDEVNVGFYNGMNELAKFVNDDDEDDDDSDDNDLKKKNEKKEQDTRNMTLFFPSGNNIRTISSKYPEQKMEEDGDDINKLLKDPEMRKQLKKDKVFIQFTDAQQSILGK